MSDMNRPNGSGDAPPGFHTFVVKAPEWKISDDALRYLEGDFAALLYLLHDLLSAGGHVEPMLAYDLGVIAERLADFLRAPRPMPSHDEASGYVASLAKSYSELVAKLDDDVTFATTDGVVGEVAATTIPTLCRLLAHAAQDHQEQSRYVWQATMEYRLEQGNLRAEQALVQRKLDELEGKPKAKP